MITFYHGKSSPNIGFHKHWQVNKCKFKCKYTVKGLSWWLSGKESACNTGAAGDLGSVSRSGGSPGGGHGNPLQYSCLGNPTDRAVWRATACSIAKSRTQLTRLSRHAPCGCDQAERSLASLCHKWRRFHVEYCHSALLEFFHS